MSGVGLKLFTQRYSKSIVSFWSPIHMAFGESQFMSTILKLCHAWVTWYSHCGTFVYVTMCTWCHSECILCLWPLATMTLSAEGPRVKSGVGIFSSNRSIIMTLTVVGGAWVNAVWWYLDNPLSCLGKKRKGHGQDGCAYLFKINCFCGDLQKNVTMTGCK